MRFKINIPKKHEELTIYDFQNKMKNSFRLIQKSLEGIRIYKNNPIQYRMWRSQLTYELIKLISLCVAGLFFIVKDDHTIKVGAEIENGFIEDSYKDIEIEVSANDNREITE